MSAKAIFGEMPQMKISTAIQTSALIALLAVPTIPALACSAAEPNTHVGNVLSVDRDAGTFTILDAENMSPVTLAADEALLDQVSSISGSVAVTYEKDGDTLRALALR